MLQGLGGNLQTGGHKEVFDFLVGFLLAGFDPLYVQDTFVGCTVEL